MDYSQNTLKKIYENNCLEQRRKNLVRLREEIAGLTQTEFSKETGIQKSNLSCLESGDRDLSLFNIQVYKTYFKEKYSLEISTDYLLGYTSVISNTDMDISSDLGLSGKSIEILRIWNEHKRNPMKYATSYGVTDIDTLNLLLEDYAQTYSSARKKGLYANFSIFHYIGNYLFSERFKRCPQNKVKCTHKSSEKEQCIGLDDLQIGNTVKTDNFEYVIEGIKTYDKCNNGEDSDRIAIYNVEKEDEMYSIIFQDALKAYDKENILNVIDRIKERLSKNE